MPSNLDDVYTIKLKGFAISQEIQDNMQLLYDILESGFDVKLKFSAFYSLLIIYREFGKYSKLIELVDMYSMHFVRIPLYNVVLSIYYRYKIILGEKEWGADAVRYAEIACDKLPTNIAVKHHYVETVVFEIEENIQVDNEHINKALERITDVISVYNTTAKYYCTKGRLLAIKEEYQDAISNINRALDLEDSNSKDAMIRIGQYNYYLLHVKVQQNLSVIDDYISDFDDKVSQTEMNILKMYDDVDDLKTKYLEYLSFFSSILAFIMITTNIAINVQDFNKFVGMIVVIAGALIISFSIFRFLLPYSRKDKHIIIKTIVALIISISFIAFGLLLGNDMIIK